MRLLPVLTLAAVSLSSCARFNDPNSSFGAFQTWQITGQDGITPLSIQAHTHLFSDYRNAETPTAQRNGEKARHTSMNQDRLLMLRLVWPGGAPLIARDQRTGDTNIIWNAGRPGILYDCLIRDTGPTRTHLYGDLRRMDEGQESRLGQCEARRVTLSP